jgi:hypothetical protein
MTAGRGREARVRPEFRDRYPGLPPGEWKPVQAMLQRLGELSPEDRAKAGMSAGERPLPDHHFEFRGTSRRPRGSAPRLSRATDLDPGHQRLAGLEGQLEAEQDQLLEREREAERSIAKAERLRDRAEELQHDVERLRERARQLEFEPERTTDESSDRPRNEADQP